MMTKAELAVRKRKVLNHISKLVIKDGDML